MKAELLNEAIKEAERFLKKAKTCKTSSEEYKYGTHFNSKDAAATKRSSMDLTRALARLRQIRY